MVEDGDADYIRLHHVAITNGHATNHVNMRLFRIGSFHTKPERQRIQLRNYYNCFIQLNMEYAVRVQLMSHNEGKQILHSQMEHFC